MKPAFRIVSDSSLHVWGLSGSERLRRQLRRRGVEELAADHEPEPDRDLILLDARYLYDPRVLTKLVETPGLLLRATGDSTAPVVAAHVAGTRASEARAILLGERPPEGMEGTRIERPETLVEAFDERLRRARRPSVTAVGAGNRRALEDRLFDDAYKGVTDFVTRFWWPRPARIVTRWCVGRGITPNQVTGVGLLFVVLAGWLFARGHFGWGLALGWAMTFLDTVDGKLARVTVTSSRIGHVLDHGTDIIHPPLWYLAWGLGLASFQPVLPFPSVGTAVAIIFWGYIVGRLAEGSYQLFVAMSGIFLRKRFDSYFRLITARRNPSLIFLTVSLLFGRPDLGLELVVVWTVLSTAVLLVRLLQGLVEKRRHGEARPWMVDVDLDTDRSLAVRWFAPRSAARVIVVEPAPRIGSRAIEPFGVGRSEGGERRIGLISNPKSRRNRMAGFSEVNEILAGHPSVLHRQACDPPEIAAVLEEFAREGVELVALNGGDGTVDAALDVVLNGSPFREQPLLAVLPGGRTNMTAGDVGVRGGNSARGLRRLVAWASAPDAGDLVERHSLRLDVGDGTRPRYGLFFAAGGLHEATVRCWNFRAGSKLPGMRTGLGTAVSVTGQVSGHILGLETARPAPVRVWLDGEELTETGFLALFVTTLERLAFGMRPYWDDALAPLRFTAVATRHGSLLRAAPALVSGRPSERLRPEHGYTSRNVHEIRIELDECTLDGEVVRATRSEPMRLSAGPTVRFVRA